MPVVTAIKTVPTGMHYCIYSPYCLCAFEFKYPDDVKIWPYVHYVAMRTKAY